MRKIEKVFNLILIMAFLCQNVAFGLPERNPALRPPMYFNKTKKVSSAKTTSTIASADMLDDAVSGLQALAKVSSAMMSIRGITHGKEANDITVEDIESMERILDGIIKRNNLHLLSVLFEQMPTLAEEEDSLSVVIIANITIITSGTTLKNLKYHIENSSGNEAERDFEEFEDKISTIETAVSTLYNELPMEWRPSLILMQLLREVDNTIQTIKEKLRGKTGKNIKIKDVESIQKAAESIDKEKIHSYLSDMQHEIVSEPNGLAPSLALSTKISSLVPKLYLLREHLEEASSSERIESDLRVVRKNISNIEKTLGNMKKGVSQLNEKAVNRGAISAQLEPAASFLLTVRENDALETSELPFAKLKSIKPAEIIDAGSTWKAYKNMPGIVVDDFLRFRRYAAEDIRRADSQKRKIVIFHRLPYLTPYDERDVARQIIATFRQMLADKALQHVRKIAIVTDYDEEKFRMYWEDALKKTRKKNPVPSRLKPGDIVGIHSPFGYYQRAVLFEVPGPKDRTVKLLPIHYWKDSVMGFISSKEYSEKGYSTALAEYLLETLIDLRLVLKKEAVQKGSPINIGERLKVEFKGKYYTGTVIGTTEGCYIIVFNVPIGGKDELGGYARYPRRITAIELVETGEWTKVDAWEAPSRDKVNKKVSRGQDQIRRNM